MSEVDQNFKAEIEASLAAAAEELELPLDVFMEIVNESLAPTKEDMTNLENAVASGDYTSIEAPAHKLKGTFGNLRLVSLIEDTTRINELAKTKTGIEEIKEIFPALKESFEKFIDAIAS